jgi:hypothetical protein
MRCLQLLLLWLLLHMLWLLWQQPLLLLLIGCWGSRVTVLLLLLAGEQRPTIK